MINSTLNDTYAIATEAESLTLTPYTYNRDNPTFVNGTIEYEQIGEPFTITLK